MDEAGTARAAIDKRRERNRKAYERSKAAGGHALLRLDADGLASLDGAAQACGLSRAAFARMFLPAMLVAFSGRYTAIEAARALRRQSLSQFMAGAIDRAIAESAPATDPIAPDAASEFDALFG